MKSVDLVKMHMLKENIITEVIFLNWKKNVFFRERGKEVCVCVCVCFNPPPQKKINFQIYLRGFSIIEVCKKCLIQRL